jgi:hypothetical protein
MAASGAFGMEAGMKTAMIFAVFVGLLAGFAAPAQVSAQAKAGAPAAAGGDTGPTSYDFEDDLVQGDLVRPDGELLSVRRRGNRASLIQIREHFIPEMLKSVEDL